MPCYSPIMIKNPCKGTDKVITSGYLPNGKPYYRSIDNFWSLSKDVTSDYIPVGCGVCPYCIQKKQLGIAQRIQMEATKNYLFFCTLTYDNEHLPTLTTSQGYTIRYASQEHITNFIKRLRKHSVFPRPFRVFYCSERGSLHARPHFHLIFLMPKFKDDDPLYASSLTYLFDGVKSEWTVNVGTRKNPIYEPLFTYVSKFVGGKLRRNYDFHYVEPKYTDGGILDCAFYVCKYMLKSSKHDRDLQIALKNNLPPSEYYEVWNKVKSRLNYSLFFGLNPDKDNNPDTEIISYLHNCVLNGDKSLGYPCYVNPDSGSVFPLCDYYKNIPQIFDLQSALSYFYYCKEHEISTFEDDPYHKFEQGLKKFDNALSRGIDTDFDFLCE